MSDEGTSPGAPLISEAEEASVPVHMPPTMELEAGLAAERLVTAFWPAEDQQQAVAEVLRAQDAEASSLWTEVEVEAAMRWMLEQPPSREAVADFFTAWLGLDSLESLRKHAEVGLDAALRESMIEEARRFGVYETLDRDGSLRSLLLAPYTFVDERLASHYGLDFPDSESDSGWSRVDFAESHRLGVLAQASVLTVHSSVAARSWPARRSSSVLESLLCLPVPTTHQQGEATPSRPAMPEDLLTASGELAELDPTRSVKQQMAEATVDDHRCTSCHVSLSINSTGSALIGFDSLGRWDPLASFTAAETSGRISAELLPEELSFQDWPDLIRQLAEHEVVGACFAEKWLRFAEGDRSAGLRYGGRPQIIVTESWPSSEAWQAASARVVAAGNASAWNLREVIVATGLEVALGL